LDEWETDKEESVSIDGALIKGLKGYANCTLSHGIDTRIPGRYRWKVKMPKGGAQMAIGLVLKPLPTGLNAGTFYSRPGMYVTCGSGGCSHWPGKSGGNKKVRRLCFYYVYQFTFSADATHSIHTFTLRCLIQQHCNTVTIM
jgi:hypothetical protein